MTRMRSSSCVLPVVFLLCACSSYAGLEVGETRVIDTAVEAEPIDYRIQPGDGLVIEFAHHPARRTELVVRPDGVISMPFAEEMRVAGRTVPEADAMLTTSVEKHLRDPSLTILVTAVAKSQVFVGGEVLRAGAVPLVPGMTAFQALTAVGGIAPTGAEDSVIVVRSMGPGKRVVKRLSLSGGDMLTNDIVLGAFDIVFVPRTTVADVGLFVNANINAIVPRAINFTAFYDLQDTFR